MKTTPLNGFVSNLHNRVRILRNIETLVETHFFQEVYESSSLEEHKKVKELIDNFDMIGLKSWFHCQRQKYLHILGIRPLRKLAQALRVKDYNVLTKSHLLSEITRKQNEQNGAYSTPA